MLISALKSWILEPGFCMKQSKPFIFFSFFILFFLTLSFLPFFSLSPSFFLILNNFTALKCCEKKA